MPALGLILHFSGAAQHSAAPGNTELVASAAVMLGSTLAMLALALAILLPITFVVQKLRRRELPSSYGPCLSFVLSTLLCVGTLLVFGKAHVDGRYTSAAKVRLNRVKMDGLISQLALYQHELGSFPESLEDLRRASEEMQRDGKPMFPRLSEEDLFDIWNKKYHYLRESNGGSYILQSFGADGQEGGDGENQDVTARP